MRLYYSKAGYLSNGIAAMRGGEASRRGKEYFFGFCKIRFKWCQNFVDVMVNALLLTAGAKAGFLLLEIYKQKF